MNPVLLVICFIGAAIAGTIAAAKGRNVVAWAVLGFLAPAIAIIVVACQSNLKTDRTQVERADRDRRRLREQLRQERQKTEAFRQYSMSRLDSHDRELGVDTRSANALPGASADPRRALTDAAAQDAAAQALPPGQTFSASGGMWYYARGGQAQGPVPEAELKHLINSGQIDGATMVWAEGLDDWARVDEISNLRTG